MRPETDPAGYLGPITEARFAEAFATVALLNKREAARLIGVDAGTLDALTADGIIRAVPRGKRRAYTERDLRCFLLGEVSAAPTPERRTSRATIVLKPQTFKFSERIHRARIGA